MPSAYRIGRFRRRKTRHPPINTRSVPRLALLVGSGPPPSKARLAAAAAAAEYVLAVDGGANCLVRYGIPFDAVAGDFDSLTVPLLESVVRIPLSDQNLTDLEKAVKHVISLGYQRLWLYGVLGGRLDHTLGTLRIVAKYGRNVPIKVFDGGGVLLLVDGEIEIDVAVGQTLSLFAPGNAVGVTTSGLQWNLDTDDVGPDGRDGTSNIATDEHVAIRVESGDLFVYIHQSSRGRPGIG